MKKHWMLLLVASCLGLASAHLYGQCQQQTCTDTGTCFKCTDVTTNVGCLVSSCNSCTTSRCSSEGTGGGGGGIGGNVCQKLPTDMSELRPASLDHKSDTNVATVFGMIGAKGAPAELMSFNVSRDSVFRHGVLLNVGKKQIIGYQLGWIFSSPSQGTRIKLGPELRLARALGPGERQDTADHPFPSSFFGDTGEIKKVGFFIAHVVFADGSSWTADLKQLEKDSSSGGASSKNKKKAA
jgi:hypothetical protein